MIPEGYIDAWREFAPWKLDAQVEQDLIISRAIVEIFSRPELQDKLAFRGGTALHKLFFQRALRYSEDLDFVQIKAEPIGTTFEGIRNALDSWLGVPRRELGENLVKLTYRFVSEKAPKIPMRLKIEINSREHYAAQQRSFVAFAVTSPWFAGTCNAPVITLPWLLGSKLRALYQRRKGRDLFDIYMALLEGRITGAEIVDAFLQHSTGYGLPISRAEFEANLSEKIEDSRFCEDIGQLLTSTSTPFDHLSAYNLVMTEVIAKVPGEPWKRPERKSEEKHPTKRSRRTTTSAS